MTWRFYVLSGIFTALGAWFVSSSPHSNLQVVSFVDFPEPNSYISPVSSPSPFFLPCRLTQMGFFRTTYIPYSIYFVQSSFPSPLLSHRQTSAYLVPGIASCLPVASLYFGRLLAATLPHRIIGRGRFSFNLNPGKLSAPVLSFRFCSRI